MHGEAIPNLRAGFVAEPVVQLRSAFDSTTQNIGGAAALILIVLSCLSSFLADEEGRTSACKVTGFSSEQTTVSCGS